MPTIWRIVKKKHQKTAFDGEGARLFGGRWNHEGDAVVYCSENLSLAALEIFVHLDRWQLAFDLIVIPIEVPDKLKCTQYTSTALAKLLKKQTEPDIGSHWAQAAETVIMIVPSAVVPQENNYILNPKHPDFAKLKIQTAENFKLDERMLK